MFNQSYDSRLRISTSCGSFLRPCLLFYLCSPSPASQSFSHAHTDRVVLHLCLATSPFLPLLLPPSLTYSTSFCLARSFFSLCQSVSLTISIGFSHCTFPPPFSFLSTTSPFGSPYLSHSGVQLSFIRFFRGKLKERLQPLLYLFSPFSFVTVSL